MSKLSFCSGWWFCQWVGVRWLNTQLGIYDILCHTEQKKVFVTIEEDQSKPAFAVFHPSRSLGSSIARVVQSATGLASAIVIDDILELHIALQPEVELLVMHDSELDVGLEYVHQRPDLQLLILARAVTCELIESMRDVPQVTHIISWPPFSTLPRFWEISLAVHDVVARPKDRTRIHQILSGVIALRQWDPRTTRELNDIVEGIPALARRAGATARLAQRVGVVAHELLMNAMYDAPVDESGVVKYSQDRSQDITLAAKETPRFRFATDGALLILEVSDPFGRLTRERALDRLAACARAEAERGADAPLDSSHGGAGLGLFRIYRSCVCLLVHVEWEQRTRVTAVFDLTLKPRDMRALDASLHCSFT